MSECVVSLSTLSYKASYLKLLLKEFAYEMCNKCKHYCPFLIEALVLQMFKQKMFTNINSKNANFILG